MAAKTNIILRNQSGAALVIALIMIVVITLIALASSYTSIFEIAMSGNKRGTTDAFYFADAGINVITSYPTQSFNLNQYPMPIGQNTTRVYTPFPFTALNIPNPDPAHIASSNASVTYITNQTGPPIGGGWSALSNSYAFFQIQCTGNDTAGSGAQTTVQQDVAQIIPISQ